MSKINLNKEFKDFSGTIIAGEMISDAIAKHLYLGKGVSVDNGDEKYAAYKLSSKIMNATKEIDVTPEEIVLIKKVAAASLTPGAYGQVMDLLEK
ncbi:MAG: hypothetical protein LBV74_03750 [Tannerella sp.]|jgi:hypothetical protein|nr:hypothetical protein [Tannerella sp.]